MFVFVFAVLFAQSVSAVTVVTVNGGDFTLRKTAEYIEQGAVAIDDIDGDITANIITTGSIDLSVLGQQYITYSVTNSVGSTTEAIRTVNVVSGRKHRVYATTTPVVIESGALKFFTTPQEAVLYYSK